MDEMISELEGEGGFKAHIHALFEAVPESTTFPRVLGGSDPESERFLVYVDITHEEQSTECHKVVEIKLEGPELKLKSIQILIVLQTKLENSLLERAHI
jgi:hypothetical protein